MNPAVAEYLSLPPTPILHRTQQRPYRASRRTAGLENALVAEYLAGATAAELGRRHGIAKSTVLKLLHNAGVTMRYPRLSRAQLQQISELYQQGFSQVEIARRIGRSPSAVWHALARKGLVGCRHVTHD